MDDTLLNKMHALLAEGGGTSRTNAATTLSVAAIEMSKQAAILKQASKAFANSFSDLTTILKAAHEMTDEELKTLKKLLGQLDTTKDKLKKYVTYAVEDAEVAVELASSLKKPNPTGRPGPEPTFTR